MKNIIVISHKKLQTELEALKAEFEHYKKESIKWSIEDFTSLEVAGEELSDGVAQIALEEMIQNHDCGLGICWETVKYYFHEHSTKVTEGNELWRQK